MEIEEYAAQSVPFKFPFTDKEDSDLNLSKSFQEYQGRKTPSRMTTRNGVNSAEDLMYSPSGLSVGLSPISKSRDSDTSSISCMGSLEGVGGSVNDGFDHPDKNKETEESSHTEIEADKNPASSGSSASLSADLHIAVEQVGQRSNTFIDKITDAAHKRKVAVTRSRDSLVAKEQQQLRTIAESESRLTQIKDELQSMTEKAGKENFKPVFEESHLLDKCFKENHRKRRGFGGEGVPKIEKRPTTTPMSPMLGNRRQGGKRISRVREKSTTLPSSLTSNKRSSHQRKNKSTEKYDRDSGNNHITKKAPATKTKNTSRSAKPTKNTKAAISTHDLKSRPDPASRGIRWNAGQMGVPKVSKRPVTVPFSPCLGPKRKTRMGTKGLNERKQNVETAKRAVNNLKRSSLSSTSTQQKAMSPLSTKSSPLLGLDLINSTRKEKTPTTPIKGRNKHTSIKGIPRDRNFKPFALRSTNRAKARKQYGMLREEKRGMKLKEERERLKAEIKILEKELKVMSKELI